MRSEAPVCRQAAVVETLEYVMQAALELRGKLLAVVPLK